MGYFPSVASSGTYTPVFTLTSNVAAAAAANPIRWSKIGKLVTIFGRITAQAIAAGACLLDMSLPFPANVPLEDFSGIGVGLVSPSPSQVAQINDDIAPDPDTAQFLWTALDNVSHAMRFTYTYTIE